MVIQSNMSPEAVVNVWADTRTIFEKFQVPIQTKTMQDTVDSEKLEDLLIELNLSIGSSAVTCTAGG
ncbi:hypothetical protein [Thalassobacillus devorans]|uniref:hypothetical protein n=1 Tax=Thalassobacillus devorans TaxID=279813 RepID=UPI00048DFE0D|nr:hypothetical protein [Thalassobacillus devorans]